MGFNYGKKRTLQEAIAETDAYVEPRACFVTYVNNAFGWQSFSTTHDTPCAHYVSHQLALKPATGFRCKEGYLLRVRELIDVLGAPIATDDVKEGDVWARLKGASGGGGKEPSSHCGMVRTVTRDPGKPAVITIRHCSSGQKKVADNDWATYFGGGGLFYRLPVREASAASHANLQRLMKGFGYEQPFGRAVRA